MTQTICPQAAHWAGYVGEFTFARLLTACKLPQVTFDSLELIKVAKQSNVGRSRIAQAKPYILSEFGTSVRSSDGKYQVKIDWELVPAAVVLDKIYAIDFVINFRGWICGVDVTLDPETLIEKRRKLNWLAPLWEGVGIDHAVVVYLQLPLGKHIQLNQTTTNLTAELRQVIKGKNKIFNLAF